ncbi:hypothetical protein SDC9_45384 [bioreactor metagenome]|uniref:TraB/GumN family protein n=1 Tax=bioreactor metagenome TaxID=1076179 RepID=A0A644W6F8_9ZZZZ
MKKSVRAIILVLCMLSAQLLLAQTDKPKALLYQISGNGLTKPSYLYGTMHVSNKIAYNLSDSFFIALKSVDMVALEINPDSFMNYSMKYILNYVSPSVRYEADYGNFYKKVGKLPELDLDVLRDMLADIDQLSNYLMFRRSSFTMNYEEGTYLDLFIYQSGKKLKKNIGHVEDYNESNELEVMSYQPDPNGDDDDYYYNYDYDPEAKPMDEQVDDAYRNRDIALIDSLMRKTSTKNHYKYFLVERNKNQADALAELMKTQSVFCGVGVAHLGGDSGVVNLLRMKGYTVSPVTQKSSRNTHKMVDKMSDVDYPLTFSTFVAEDSLFSVSMPGDVYTVYADNSELMYYCPEMVNGAYYQIVRIRTKEQFSGMTKENRLHMIDSLLYEAMPGKITSKKEISTKDGMKGFDVISETPNSNWIRTQIYASENEILIFKVRGEGKYALEKNGNTFFTSLRFANQRSESYSTYVNPSLAIQLDMPDNRISHELYNTGIRSRTPQLLRLEAFDQAGKQHYRFILAGLHDFTYLESDTFELKAIIKEFFDDLDIEDYKDTIGRNGADMFAEGRASKDGINYFVRTLLKGPSYAVLAFSSPDSAAPEKYFNSFRWTGYQYRDGFSDVTDTSMYFTSRTILNDVNVFSRTLYNRSRSTSSMFFGSTSLFPTKKALTLYGTNVSETFSSSETPEFVEVSFKRFPKYLSYDSTSLSFLNSSSGYYYSSNPYREMVKKTIRQDSTGSQREYYYCYSDTGVSRVIHVKHFLKDGALYTIKALCDSTEGLTGWTKEFFDNFRPSDTTFGTSIFQSKGSVFLDDFVSSDSLTKAIAREVESSVEFDESCADKLISFLKSDDFRKLNEEDRENILDYIDEIKSPELTDVLSDLYKELVDSVSLQHSILSVLSHQMTRKSFDTVLELMEFDIPLADNYESFSDIYAPMYDSLELARTMFPALLEFTRYPEHRKYIYGLLLALRSKEMVPQSMITTNYKTILADANEEFKRAKTEGLSSSNTYEIYDWLNAFATDLPEVKKEKIDTVCFEIRNANLFEVLMQLLITDYGSNKQTREFFSKVLNTRQDDILYSTILVMEKSGIPVHDSIWTSLSKKPEMVVDVYKYLNRKGRTNLMDQSSLTQQFFAYSKIYNSYNKEDSIVFLKSSTETIGDKTGIVYYFKAKRDGDKIWRLAYSGPYPADGSVVVKVQLTKTRDENIGKKSDGEEEINKVRKSFYYFNRPRAKESYYGDYY